jgi:hypothetical protein
MLSEYCVAMAPVSLARGRSACPLGARSGRVSFLELIPFAPMGRLDIDVPSTPSVDPIGSVLVTRKWKRVDDTIIVQHADFEISVRWRYSSGLPFGGE